MNRYLWMLLIALVLSLGARAQISGLVLDAADQSPIPSAHVMWEGTSVSTTTDSEGKFTIDKPAGSSTLMVHALGYETMTMSIISRKGSYTFRLKTENSELDEITVQEHARETGVDIRSASHQLNISQGELRKAACCNLSESFETNASVDVNFTDAVTGTKQIEMLGLSGKYVLIQRENIPFARGINATGGLTFIPGPFVESIQLTKGLSSVVNGYESISGQINVEFLQPTPEFDLVVNGYLNQGARAEGNVWVSTPVSDNVSTGVLAHYSNVPFAQDRNGDGFADMPIGEQFTLHNRWKYFINDEWGGQAGIMINSDTRSSGQLEDVFTPQGSEQPWLYEQKDDRYEFFGKTGYISSSNSERSIGIVYGASYQDRSTTAGNRVLASNQTSAYVNAIYQDMIGNPNHTFKTGLSFQYDDLGENLSYTSISVGPINAYNRSETVPGAFFEYAYSSDNPWTVVAGLRADYSNIFGMIITPRVNLKYIPFEGTTLRFGGGRGQRSVNYYNESTKGLLSNRSYMTIGEKMQAEIAWNTGVSWTQDFLLFDRGASFSTDVFYTYFENKLIGDFDYLPQVYAVYFSEGSSSTSVLAQFDFSPLESLEARVAYKYLDAKDQFLNGNAASFGIPKHRAFLNLAYEFLPTWKVDATYNWFGPRRVMSTAYYPSSEVQSSQSPDYSTVNLQLNKSFGKHWDTYIGVENLFNYRQDNPILHSDDTQSVYFDANRVYGPVFGRMIYAGFYYKLN